MTAAADSPLVVREDRGGRVAGLVLNRPEKLNAINREMIAELVAAVDQCVRDPSVGVIVIRGEGRAFAAGADASPSGAMRDRSANTNREELLDELWGRFQCLWDAPKPVIAQVHGYCLGAGTILCSFADVVVVADDSEIGWPSLPLGGGVEEVLFAFYVGARKAKEYAFQTAMRIDGREAHDVGWANRSVPLEQLHDTVQRMAERMARTPPGLLRLKKESINRVVDQMGFRDAVRVSAAWCVLSHTDPGVAAVLDRVRAQGIKATIAEYDAQ